MTDFKYDIIQKRKEKLAKKVSDYAIAIQEESALLVETIKVNPNDAMGIRMRSGEILKAAISIQNLSSAINTLHDVRYLMEGSEKP